MSNTQVRSNGAYAPLGANYADDDAIATLDLEENDRAELLWCRGLAYCSRTPRTEGYISDVALATGKVLRRTKRSRTTPTVEECAVRLQQLGLWTREGDGYRIASWLKWNKSWDEISKKRAQDRARKGGTGEDSDGSSDGSHADSARNASGVAAPRQYTAVQGKAVQGSSKATGDASAAPEPAGSTPAQALLDEHLAHRAMPEANARTMHQRIVECLREADPDDVRAALTEWRRRPGAKPGLLPLILNDVLEAKAAQALADDPTQTPEAQEWLARETAKREAAHAARTAGAAR